MELSDGEPIYLASLGHAHAMAGDRTAAEAVLEQLQQQSVSRYVPAFHVAVIHAALGDIDSAFEYLERAFEDRSPWIGYLRVDPRVDPLRDDPRFQALLERAQLDF